MSLATLFGALVFGRDRQARICRAFMIANGCILPFLLLQMYWHSLIWIAAAWAITFPAATWSLAVWFRRSAVSAPAASHAISG